MQVILLDDVPELGLAGDVVKVKDGYARNYLIPQGLAQKISTSALNRIEQIKSAGEAKRIRRISDAKDKISILHQKNVLVPMKAGAENKLFGAVTTKLIADKVKEQYGIDLDRRFILQEEPFKYLGEFEVPLRAGDIATGKLIIQIIDEEIYLSQGLDNALAQIRGEEVSLTQETKESTPEPQG